MLTLTCIVMSATNEYALEVLEAVMERFDTKLLCHGPHKRLLEEINMRKEVLQRIRTFLESMFGTAEGSTSDGDNKKKNVDSYRLEKIRYDIARWEKAVNERLLVLVAMGGSMEKIAHIYEPDKEYKEVIKEVVLDLSVILDNLAMPDGW